MSENTIHVHVRFQGRKAKAIGIMYTIHASVIIDEDTPAKEMKQAALYALYEGKTSDGQAYEHIQQIEILNRPGFSTTRQT